MDKLLTVSVAAYNMEKYLEKCLDSLTIPEIMEELEVFIVDDGSTDATLNIAKSFAKRYPKTFIPVHKENGGYGTTVNYSIAHATGKYFRCLDGDDWFDREGLVRSLSRLREINTDVVVMPAFHVSDEGRRLGEIGASIADGRKIPIKDYREDRVFGIWTICYKTQMLKNSGLVLPPHVLFTDQYYSTVPFATAETIQSIDTPVYCYRIGRDGQSISRENRIEHTQENLDICLDLCRFYEFEKARNNMNCPYLQRRISQYYMNAVHTILLHQIGKQGLERLKWFDGQIKANSPDIYDFALRRKTKISILMRSFRITDYRTYWALKLIRGGGTELELKLRREISSAVFTGMYVRWLTVPVYCIKEILKQIPERFLFIPL